MRMPRLFLFDFSLIRRNPISKDSSYQISTDVENAFHPDPFHFQFQDRLVLVVKVVKKRSTQECVLSVDLFLHYRRIGSLCF